MAIATANKSQGARTRALAGSNRRDARCWCHRPWLRPAASTSSSSPRGESGPAQRRPRRLCAPDAARTGRQQSGLMTQPSQLGGSPKSMNYLRRESKRLIGILLRCAEEVPGFEPQAIHHAKCSVRVHKLRFVSEWSPQGRHSRGGGRSVSGVRSVPEAHGRVDARVCKAPPSRTTFSHLAAVGQPLLKGTSRPLGQGAEAGTHALGLPLQARASVLPSSQLD